MDHIEITWQRRVAGALVHLLTASTAVIGFYTLIAIYRHQYVLALWLMGAAVVIDAVDGTLARLVRVKMVLPQIDGAMLDNIMDYLNYVITPAFFLFIHPDFLNGIWRDVVIMAIVLSSAYQFTQTNAKTDDNFFLGFPSYWNLAVLYLFLFQTPAAFNAVLLIVLAILVFVPIKYVYPSRMEHLFKRTCTRRLMLLATVVYGIVSFLLLWIHPKLNVILVAYTVAYVILYFALSLYRTIQPKLSR